MDEELHIGSVIRMLIENHQKDKPTNKSIIRSTFKIREMDLFMEKVNMQLEKYKMELIGINKEKNAENFRNSEKVFIVKRLNSVPKKNVNVSNENIVATNSGTNAFIKNSQSDIVENSSLKSQNTTASLPLIKENDVENKIQIIGCKFFKTLSILTIIYLEDENCEIKALEVFLEETEIFFDNYEIQSHLSMMKSKGYITYFKEEEETYVRFSWRFYAEFPKFNPSKVFKNIEVNERLKKNRKNHNIDKIANDFKLFPNNI